MSSADLWTSVDDMLPEPGRDILMCWLPEKAIKQGKFFGPNSGLHGFAVLEPKGRHYVGKVFISHWCYLEDALPPVVIPS